MASPSNPPCPQCASTDVALLSRSDSTLLERVRQKHQSTETHFVYKCSCGVAFTYTPQRRSARQPQEHLLGQGSSSLR